MLKVKIAHCADLHIGCGCFASGEKALIRKNELKNVFFKILDVCVGSSVDVLLIAGDLFDDVNVSIQDVSDVKTALKNFKIKTVIAPGNHDPFTPDSPYSGEWPENVFIFKNNNAECFEIEELGLNVWGAAFKGVYEKKGLLKKFDDFKESMINICVMHGNIESGADEVYNPITHEDLKNSKMDYVALGHIHKKSDVCIAGNTHYAYCGCPEGHGFDETGDKGFYIGSVSKGACELSFQKTARRDYVVLEVDVSEISADYDIVQKILENARSLCGEVYCDNLYKIILSGDVTDDFMVDTQKIELFLSDKLFFCKVLDNTKVKMDIQKLSMRGDLRGIFIKKMMNHINSLSLPEEKETANLALKLGLRAFGEDVKYYAD